MNVADEMTIALYTERQPLLVGYNQATLYYTS